MFLRAVAVPRASLPLFTSAIVPHHVSTTILDRRQTEAAVIGTWDLACTAACREPPRPIESSRFCFRSTTTCSVLTQPLYCLLLLSTTRQLEKSSTRCSRRPMHDPFVSNPGRKKKSFFPTRARRTCSLRSLNMPKVEPILILTIISPRQRLKGPQTLNTSRNRPGWLRRNAWPLPAVLSSSIMACQNLLHCVLQMRSSPPSDNLRNCQFMPAWTRFTANSR